MSATGVVLSPIREDPVLSPSHFPGQLTPLHESIMVYLTVSGSLIPMRVLESDSIATIKLRIQNCQGIVTKRPKLVFAGRELARNDSLVKDYGVADGNVLHLVLRLSDLRNIVVRTVCGKEYEFQVERCRNIRYLKQQIKQKGKGFLDPKDQELICNGERLDDQRLIDDVCKDNDDAVIHLLVRKTAKVRVKPVGKDLELSIEALSLGERTVNPKKRIDVRCKDESEVQLLATKYPGRDYLLEPVTVNPRIKLSPVLKDLIHSTVAGLEKGYSPIRSSEGSGGAYFMSDFSGNKQVSVFKPIDEEPMAVNNPRGLPLSKDGEGLKRGTRVGEGAYREVAAYILDHPKGGRRPFSSDEVGFSGVPPTVMIQCLHAGFNHPEGYAFSAKNLKIGSLQMFVKNHGSCEDMGPRAFPVEEVHKISVLDIRLANVDRHSGNILVCKEGKEGRIVLVPIDHGYCLPEKFEDCTFDWLYWPQAHQPYSPETIDHIMSLDADQDIALLKFHGWDLSLEVARTLRISTMLLKKGVQRGLTPFTIGSIMCRETLKKESVIEEIVRQAEETVLPGMSEAAFLDSVSQIMDRRLDEIDA